MSERLRYERLLGSVVNNLSAMETSNGECEPVLQEAAAGVSAQKDMVVSLRDVAKGDGKLSHLGVQESWEIERRQLEKELYECTRAHKMSIVQGAYEMSKLQVSFGVVKRQESLAKEQLEDALVLVKKLQKEVERLNGQLRHTETENMKLSTELSSLRSELNGQTAKGESIHREPEAAKKTPVKSVDVVKILSEETVPLLAQHDLQTKQLQKIENNMETGEGLVTDQNVLEKWTVENEALHSATMQIEELKQRLAVRERLEADLTTSQQGIEKVTKEKEELLMQLETATKELLECKKMIAETEMHDVEQVRYSQVIAGLNVEKMSLISQLELLRGELENQKEAAKKAQTEASKAMEAERECAKAFKLVEEKEEEMEYYVRQLESLREKNNMLRTQLDMEQQCKEIEMAGMPKVHEQVMNQFSRNFNTSIELVASNSVQNPQKIPPEPTSLHAQGAITTAPNTQKQSNDSSLKPLQDASREGIGSPPTEGPVALLNPEPVAIQQPAKPTVKKSLRLRNRAHAQQSMDSGSATTGAIKQVIYLTENDEDNGVIEDVRQSKSRSISRLQKRAAVPMPSEAETSKKKGRKKNLNVRRGNDTDAELGLAHLLVKKSDRVGARPTPFRSNTTPRSGSRLPR